MSVKESSSRNSRRRSVTVSEVGNSPRILSKRSCGKSSSNPLSKRPLSLCSIFICPPNSMDHGQNLEATKLSAGKGELVWCCIKPVDDGSSRTLHQTCPTLYAVRWLCHDEH